mmetsp:Transcript_513/g.741  ORF Transcript_513/g.741 Transcript_513/m.741 type:complete len:117 (+) Transcript_513:328-678(+)|eukprot:CAMPEP_0185270896 /NCGR_PEP_ID=MMETSP1359-20130426/43432_1 /TAXON_ID=552665 /ORGANISM="Bigelowiella longifila, Strain CCMP242" /LENGTH=116 /DNA_ID=CAMNT_0027862651 /DNA_START=325 /DNA_END=675 /DNA_ORIENTATION=+
MHDVLSLERGGLSSVALISDEFMPQALYQGKQVVGRAMKSEELLSLIVWVQHPISDQTEQQMFCKADHCYERVLLGLTNGGVAASNPARKLLLITQEKGQEKKKMEPVDSTSECAT